MKVKKSRRDSVDQWTFTPENEDDKEFLELLRNNPEQIACYGETYDKDLVFFKKNLFLVS